MALQEVLMQVPGVSGVRDDLPFGRDQLIYELTPEGEVLGFTYTALARQLSDAYSGRLVQIFTDKEDEVEVRLQLPRSEQATLASLSRMQVVSPSGVRVPLSSVAKWESQRGFDIMRHVDGRLAVTVIGEVDKSVNNANRILDQLKATTLKSLVEQYGIQYSLEGQNARQVDTLADMKIGLFIGLSIIYIVLAWVFASYSFIIETATLQTGFIDLKPVIMRLSPL